MDTVNVKVYDIADITTLKQAMSRNTTTPTNNTIRVEFFANPKSTLTQFGYMARLSQSQYKKRIEVPIGLNTINPIADIIEALNKGGYAITSVVEYDGMYYLGTDVVKPFT